MVIQEKQPIPVEQYIQGAGPHASTDLEALREHDIQEIGEITEHNNVFSQAPTEVQPAQEAALHAKTVDGSNIQVDNTAQAIHSAPTDKALPKKISGHNLSVSDHVGLSDHGNSSIPALILPFFFKSTTATADEKDLGFLTKERIALRKDALAKAR